MPIAEWADEQFSKDLPVLRSRGENQDLEYMESFPQNVRDLAKEIAAFATSNQGTIMIGVSDNGDLVGINEALTADGRDELLRRIEGICRGTVKPALTPTVKFAVENGRPVLILVIPKGSQPVYYCNNIPYIRHITESRPAEPHEIIELLRVWLSTADLEEARLDPLRYLISKLASILIDVIIYGDESETRNVNPWLEMWRAQFRQAASELRELAIQDVAIRENLSHELNELAHALDEITNFRLYLGYGNALSVLVTRAVDIAKQIKRNRIDSLSISQSLLDNVAKTIINSARKLKSLVDRAEEMVSHGRIEEFQTEVSNTGYTLLKVSHYNINSLQEGLSQKLLLLGRGLHLVETMRLYIDGGQSIRAIVDKVSERSKELDKIANSFSFLSQS